MRLLLPAFILLSTVAVAQDSDAFDQAVPRHAIKFSPGHLLINHHPTIEFSYEQRVARRWTIQGEYGHIVNLRTEDGDNRQNHAWKTDRKGYKAKLEGRYYLFTSDRGMIAGYGAGELYYNNFNYLKHIDPSDREKFTQRIYQEEKGTSVKFGFLWNLGPCLVDVNSGICYRFIHFSDLSPIFEYNEPSFFESLVEANTNNEKSREATGLVLGIRIGYRFPWRRSA